MIPVEQKKWLTYWKKSLSDAAWIDFNLPSEFAFSSTDFKLSDSRISDLYNLNRLIDEAEKKQNNKRRCYDKEDKDWQSIQSTVVVIAPFSVHAIPDNKVFYQDKAPKYPFWFAVSADRFGVLDIPEEIFPFVQRQYLEPIADEQKDYIFSSVENVDEATPMGSIRPESYEDYISLIESIFEKITDQRLESYDAGAGYVLIKNYTFLLPDEELNAAAGILNLYENILNSEDIPPLLSQLISPSGTVNKNPVCVEEFPSFNAMHMGQMGFEFPISLSQRVALHTYLTDRHRILAVNGPPGTGKTTLLQSVVANEIVKTAIRGKEPAIILACSTNNQAVTNILESFSKSKIKPGPLQGRWIPDADGYAVYLPSLSKGVKSGINYKKTSGEGLFSRLEKDDYILSATNFFLKRAGEYLGTPQISLSEVYRRIREELVEIQGVLESSSRNWEKYLEVEKLFLLNYLKGEMDSPSYFSGRQLNAYAFQQDISKLKRIEESIDQYFKNEGFLRKIGCALGFKKSIRNRIASVNIILRDSFITAPAEDGYERSKLLELIGNRVSLASQILNEINNWNKWKSLHQLKGNPPRNEEQYWEAELSKIHSGKPVQYFFDEMDIDIRHRAFQLAVHYWEGRWLEETANCLRRGRDSKGKSGQENTWKRHAMLMPCFVSTFYMAPKFFSYYRFVTKDGAGKNVYDTPPLAGIVDLLLVDEAGQVSPEVGVATFALAQKALVVGDIKQIEPVWNISAKLDSGNLRKLGLIQAYGDPIIEKQYLKTGFLSSAGSIMKMAQNACGCQQKGTNERGVMLLEHRRCYDEIINYCNELAYNGQLKPLKGTAGTKTLFPPMSGVHVSGNSEVKNKDRYNESEVTAITDWLTKQRSAIEEYYSRQDADQVLARKESLENIVGIITPFVGQKNRLKKALKKAGFNTDRLTIGTVHALQGAERPIILFSSVYGEKDNVTYFFDRDNKPNMLNVAVSRAKDSFIVFGNRHIFNRKNNTPSGILARHIRFSE